MINKLISILLILFSFSFSQEGSVKGIVTGSDDNLPLVGATVIIVGTTQGAATDVDGVYELKLALGSHKLSVSMVGYSKKTVNIEITENETKVVNVKLSNSEIQTNLVVVTANKREQSLAEVPVSMSIIDNQTVEMRSNASFDEALRYVPGVNIIESSVSIRGTSGYSRGVGSRVMFLLDGMPLLTGDTGEMIFETIPMLNTDRVEIVKGAGSALYGSSALGGVINILTRPIPLNTEVRFRMLGKLYDNPPKAFSKWKWHDKPLYMNAQYLSMSHRFGDIGFTFAGTRYHDDGFREYNWARRAMTYTKVDVPFGETRSLTFITNFLYQYRADFVWWKNLDNALTVADDQKGITYQTDRLNTSLKWSDKLTEDFSYDIKAVYFYSFWRAWDSIGTGMNNSQSRVFNAEIQGNYKVNDEIYTTFGVVAKKDQVNANLFRLPTTGSKPGSMGFASYLQAEYAYLENLNFTVGGRYDYQKVDGLKKSNYNFNPKVAVNYIMTENTSLRSSWGKGYRSPSTAELFTTINLAGVFVVPNPTLLPEESQSFEVGVIQKIGDNVTTDFSVFSNKIDNLIEAIAYAKDDGSGLEVKFMNVTEALIQGSEWNTSTTWFDNMVKWDFNLTYLWPYNTKDKTVLSFRPRYVASTNIFTTMDKFTFGFDSRFVSKIEKIDKALELIVVNSDIRVPSFITDFRSSYDLTDYNLPLRLNFQVLNIFNYVYVELIANVAPMRQFVFSIEGSL